MKIISRYPVRVVIPTMLLTLAILGVAMSYLLYNVLGARLIEGQATHFVSEAMVRYQSRLNEALQDRDMERLHNEVAFLNLEDNPGTTLVVNESGLILSASNPAWLGQPLMKAALHGEGKELLVDFFQAREGNPQRAVTLSRDRQVIYAICPLLIGENPAQTGLLYHEHQLQGSKKEGQLIMLRNLSLIFALFTVIAIVIWLYFYRVFFQRILLLIKAMDSFGQGDTSARSGLTGNDELATLSVTMNKMLDKQVESTRQIYENGRLLKDLTDGLPVLIAYVDKEARYRFVNKEFENWFYLKPEQLVGRQISDLLDQEGFAEIAAHISQALAGKVVTFEDAIPTHGNGLRKFHATLLPHYENGSGVTGCFLLAQDITQQKTDQDLLIKAKEQWERTFDTISDEIITIQDKEFRILQANSAAAKFFDIPREEIIGRHCYELFREEKIHCLECPAYAVLKDGTPHSTELYHDRLQKWFLVTISPLIDENGEFFGVVHSAKDVTKFKQLEQHLRQAQKMEAIGTLAGGIAHDFNNILTPILGYSEMVVAELPSGSRMRDLVQAINTAGLRAKELVKQILTFSRQNEKERQPVLIHLIIKEALKLLRSSIPTSIAIKQNVVDCGLVMADPTQLHQVLMNLCTNAYHAMQTSGGELSVSLSVVELTAQDLLDKLALLPGPHVKLSVRDTGCGMTKELQERIFEPYFTTKKQGEGTGLGLSMVHGIVESYQGHITVYSEPGGGTEFHVYLPQVEVRKAEGDKESAMQPIPQGSGTILLVDDEPVVGELLQEFLLSFGYEVMLCSSSSQALETFQQHKGQIALVLTDMAMPGMNGVELTQQIKKLSPATPVVLCTGFSHIIDEKKAKRMGIDGFLLKPVIRRQLAQIICDVMEKKG